jgi:hypothetical protein
MRTSVLALLCYAALAGQALAHSMMTVPRGRGNVEWWGTCGKNILLHAIFGPISITRTTPGLTSFLSFFYIGQHLALDVMVLVNLNERSPPFCSIPPIQSKRSVEGTRSQSIGNGSIIRGGLCD